jgi:Lrp/AsnC family transcriptional regulator for asnA, asnC and gidA
VGEVRVTSADVDDLDRQIIAILQRDGRTSNREVARRLDVSEGTVRSRVRRLNDSKTIRITAVSDVGGIGSFAWVGLQVEGGAARRVAAALGAMPEFGFVAVTLGRYDVLALAIVESPERLHALLLDQVVDFPGVRRTETWSVTRTSGPGSPTEPRPACTTSFSSRSSAWAPVPSTRSSRSA